MQSEKIYNPKIYNWVFLFLLFLLAYIYHYHQILWLRPYSLHQWRQCDCLSIILNYYKENLPFLQPSVHCVGLADNGKAMSEFPIIYYVVAQLWKIFGQQEWILRAINTSLLFAGLFSFYKMAEDVLKHSVWAILITILFFTSPILVVYGNNFIADVPALSLALIGWRHFWKFYEYKKDSSFYWSIFFFTFATLLKASAVMSLAASFALLLIEALFKTKLGANGQLFLQKSKQFIIYFISFTLIASWYLYASWYNNHNNKDFFLVGILPIWGLNSATIHETAQLMWDNIIPQFFKPI